ncbi:GatB/YqeY domain-containing protein [Pararhizobium mangrovi]|uniref:GatB/YqeY domain-containing protein n=1 Tax=Pararhizobium mangrovi TaxID=2590452 RepID=A0A506UAR9_9HYPH|nr:GatB/YqeY domain-containing protein [Pararhizobium mangrovi]TPW30466.1 GatB/YqeY domain-containing protein [Pararhizobium mangrovi]
MREKFAESLKEAMRAKDARRLTTIRLIQAAVKDRDLANRASGKEPVGDDEIMLILVKMIRQREESVAAYEEAARLELAEQEREEIAVIRQFMPEQMPEEEVQELCRSVVEETNAQGLRDMGKCMNTLKQRYPGRMDFTKASGVVKGLLR